jgi:hypothetical protein
MEMRGRGAVNSYKEKQRPNKPACREKYIVNLLATGIGLLCGGLYQKRKIYVGLRELEILKYLLWIRGNREGRRVKPLLRILGAWVLPFHLYPILFTEDRKKRTG